MCCSVLQCVAVCCIVLQLRCSVLQCAAGASEALFWEDYECVAVLQYIVVCCSMLQCVAKCCRAMQEPPRPCVLRMTIELQCVAACCSVVQCVAAWCRVIQSVAVCRSCL